MPSSLIQRQVVGCSIVFPPSNEVRKYAREIELTRNAHIVLTQRPKNQGRARIAPTKFYSVLLHRYVAEVEKQARRTKHASLYQFLTLA
ncbi:hypothetical protein P692DRAFT_201798630 [Suillus brevipes Sb2]|nr:hypothetical protein P692DRAFT_201798630 [Suillus brevipes Sb2]